MSIEFDSLSQKICIPFRENCFRLQRNVRKQRLQANKNHHIDHRQTVFRTNKITFHAKYHRLRFTGEVIQ